MFKIRDEAGHHCPSIIYLNSISILDYLGRAITMRFVVVGTVDAKGTDSSNSSAWKDVLFGVGDCVVLQRVWHQNEETAMRKMVWLAAVVAAVYAGACPDVAQAIGHRRCGGCSDTCSTSY